MHLVLTFDPPRPITSDGDFSAIRSHHSHVNQAIQAVLEACGHQVTQVCADEQLEVHLAQIRPQFAFNLSIQCKQDESRSYAPAILEKMRIPFTGSSAEACANIYHKDRTKVILDHVRIRTAKWRVIENSGVVPDTGKMKYPLFIKPICGGCSFAIGVENVIRQPGELINKIEEFSRKFGISAILEEFLPGREFTIGILGNKDAHILPIMEFLYSGNSENALRSYERKMTSREEKVNCPAVLERGEKKELEDLALQTYRALGCRDYARIDIRMDRAGKPCILEVNALPNLIAEESSFAGMAKKDGMEFRELISKILAIAAERYEMGRSGILT